MQQQQQQQQGQPMTMMGDLQATTRAKSNRLAPFKRASTINVAGGSLQDLKNAHRSGGGGGGGGQAAPATAGPPGSSSNTRTTTTTTTTSSSSSTTNRSRAGGGGGGGQPFSRGRVSSARRMFQAGSAGLLLAQNQHISQSSIHSQSGQLDVFPDQQLANMFVTFNSPAGAHHSSGPFAGHHQSSQISQAAHNSQAPASQQQQQPQLQQLAHEQANQQQQQQQQHHHQADYLSAGYSGTGCAGLSGNNNNSNNNNNNLATAGYSAAHKSGLDSSNSAISSEQCNDQEHEDRPSCLQIMRKLFFSLLLGIIIAICWVLIIHTLKWVAIRGNEYELASQRRPPLLPQPAANQQQQQHLHNHHQHHHLASSNHHNHQSHRSLIQQQQQQQRRPSRALSGSAGQALLKLQQQQQQRRRRQPLAPKSSAQPQQKRENQTPSSQLLKQRNNHHQQGNKSDHHRREAAAASPPLSTTRAPIRGARQVNSGNEEEDDDDDNNDDDDAGPMTMAPDAGGRDANANAEPPPPPPPPQASPAEQKRTTRPLGSAGSQQKAAPSKNGHQPGGDSDNRLAGGEQIAPGAAAATLEEANSQGSPARPRMDDHDDPANSPADGQLDWGSPAGEPILAGQATPAIESAEMLERAAPPDGLVYKAPFFTSWFVSTWNILFMPVFTLISSCCFRNEDSNTKKLLVRESISQFMDNGLTTLQFLGRCAFFSVLWIGTIFGIVYSLYNIDATVVMALFACSATLVYLLSWVLLHQQFVGVRIVAVIICTTGIALLAYMDNSRTLGSVLMVAGSALCSAVYKVIYQRMFGFWSIAQMSLFFTLIGLFNAFLMWPIALLLYFLGVELIVWRYIPWMHLTAAGALHLSANILAYFGPICSYDIFLTLGLLFAVIFSAAIDVNFYKITFAGMKLAGVVLLMIGFLVCLLPENWNEFLYDLVNERFVRWKKQRSMKKSRNKVQDLSTGQTSRLRTPSGRVK